MTDPGPDGRPDGHERVRLPKMGAGNASRQWPGRDSPAHHRARPQGSQACIAGVADTEDADSLLAFDTAELNASSLGKDIDVLLQPLGEVESLMAPHFTQSHTLNAST